MASPAQMFDNELNGLKAFYPGQPWVVDKAVNLDSTVDETGVVAGMVVHIDATSGEFKLGVSTTTLVHAPMPFILFQSGQDFDVVGDDGNFVGSDPNNTSITPRLMGLATNFAAEVEVTAGSYDSDTYAPGDLLSAGTDGFIEKIASSGLATCLGVVSEGEVTSEHDNSLTLLRFHTAYFVRAAS